MAKNKNRVQKIAEKIPLVSVIIPMYNSARFISQTLESLLYQTMTNFEVVVVDDCSTDNSIAVVKNFAERFSGRLHIIKLPKNTGTPGLPRNVGIQFAHGKYIVFLDSDDLFTKTALEELSGLAEELSTLAENYQADVIHMDATFNLWNNEPKADDAPEMTDINALLDKSNSIIWRPPDAEILNEPTFETQNLAQRIKTWVKFGYRWAVSSSFIRKDFLTANQIYFSKLLGAEDMLFKFRCLCTCKKFLRVPNITYIIRPRAGSITHEKETFDSNVYLHKWVNILIVGANEFDKVMSEMKFFRENPTYRYAVIDFFFKKTLRLIPLIYAKVPTSRLHEVLKKEFHADEAVLCAYLFNAANVYRLKVIELQQELDALKNSN